MAKKFGISFEYSNNNNKNNNYNNGEKELSLEYILDQISKDKTILKKCDIYQKILKMLKHEFKFIEPISALNSNDKSNNEIDCKEEKEKNTNDDKFIAMRKRKRYLVAFGVEMGVTLYILFVR